MKKILSVLGVLGLAMLSGCLMPGAGTEENPSSPWTMVIYLAVIVVFFVAMYFIAIRPERKREKKQKELLASMAVGDTVLTTSGFYGVVIDITNDTVIVEFGNNKNCRIPMQKAAIVQLEHPEGYVAPAPAEEPKKEELKKEDKKEKKEKK